VESDMERENVPCKITAILSNKGDYRYGHIKEVEGLILTTRHILVGTIDKITGVPSLIENKKIITKLWELFLYI
jgi:hypothetical protein